MMGQFHDFFLDFIRCLLLVPVKVLLVSLYQSSHRLTQLQLVIASGSVVEKPCALLNEGDS
jgi:hypothetical protein